MIQRFPLLGAMLVAALTLSSPPLAASEAGATFEHATLAPIQFQPSSLTVAGPNGARTYDAAALEAAGAWRLVTRTPWRDTAARFEGARLRDLLAANGLEDAPAIRVVAENDYAVVIPREVWRAHDALIATRVDGHAHSRRARGPLQFVFAFDAEPETGAKGFEQYWVWMAARIEPAE